MYTIRYTLASMIQWLLYTSTLRATSSISLNRRLYSKQRFFLSSSSRPSLGKDDIRVPARDVMLKNLKNGEIDLLIIGGGSTGSGAALDAATRGLRVVCVEREDFSSGTSSRSTKLIWGGSRYLVQALVSLFNQDLRLVRSPVKTITKFLEDFKMVLNCHRERRFLLEKQPHLTNWLPIAVPLTKWILWPPPFGYPPAALGPLGLFPLFFKFYDSLAGFSCPPSHIMTPSRARRKFPQLANNLIKYCPIFYEGMHDDARTNLAIALTAAQQGALMLNYCEVVGLIKNGPDAGKVSGAIIRDNMSGETFEISAKSTLLCGGPFTDELRRMEDPKCSNAVDGASGIHIVLPAYYAPSGIGLVDMNTSDGRFLFFLPWEGRVVVGTTDQRCTPSMRPEPPEDQIRWLLTEAAKYLNPALRIRRQDVLSAWSGVRPLAMDPHAVNTAGASRDHVISHNPNTGIVFISGGKWTTYREMAEDAIDKVLEVGPFKRGNQPMYDRIGPCKTLDVDLIGKEGYSEMLHVRLVQEFGVSPAVARHLAKAYGGRARELLSIRVAGSISNGDQPNPLHGLLVAEFPYIEAEVIFSTRHEWAVHAEDVIARRTRLAFLSKVAALRAVPRVVALMAGELGWDDSRQKLEVLRCVRFMNHFGGPEPAAQQKAAPGATGDLAAVRVRMATDEDIRQAYLEMRRLHSVGSSLRDSASDAATDDESDVWLDASAIELVAELLGHTLAAAEIEDCLTLAKATTDPKSADVSVISLKAFSQWWNSPRFNPGLEQLKSNLGVNHHQADSVHGPGTLFG